MAGVPIRVPESELHRCGPDCPSVLCTELGGTVNVVKHSTQLRLRATLLVRWSGELLACLVRALRGDVAGAWRALDTDLSGSITLQETSTPLLVLFCLD